MGDNNNGIQIFGGTFQADNLAVGKQARATKNVPASASQSESGTGSQAPEEPFNNPQTTHQKVFICYSHKDSKWLKRLQVHLKPLERSGLMEVWDDTRISIGAKWKEELQLAITSSSIAVLLVSADFLASDFIGAFELPRLLSQVATTGTVIMPVIVAPCLFKKSGLDIFQAANPPDKPLSDLSASASEQALVRLAEAITKSIDDA